MIICRKQKFTYAYFIILQALDATVPFVKPSVIKNQMRKLLLLLCFIALVLMRANAQWEKIIKVNTGTAEFTGRNATGGTFINEGYGGKSYSNSPTGTKKGLLFE